MRAPHYRLGRSTKIPHVFLAVPPDNEGTWGLITPSGSLVTIHATFNALVRVLGLPNGIADEWVLLHDGGKFTIYEYKATSEYADDLPSRSDFRKMPYDWHIGTDGSSVAAQGATLVKKAVESTSSSHAKKKIVPHSFHRRR